MSRLETEIRHAFERRIKSIPARPDLRAHVSDAVARGTSRVKVWQVMTATAGLLLFGALTFYGLLSRNSRPALFIPPSGHVLSPVPSVSATSAPTASQSACPPPWRICTTTTATGNFDGSGQSEVFSASFIRDQSGSAYWLLQVTRPSGNTVSARLDRLLAAHDGCPAVVPGYAIVRGAAKFAGPTRDLALVEIDRGASTEIGILVGVQKGNLDVAIVTNGASRCQRTFPWFGSVTHGNGLACGMDGTNPVLWVRQVEDHPPIDYDHYDWYQATYAWQGFQLSLLSLEHGVITRNDSRFQPSYAVACGTIHIPG